MNNLILKPYFICLFSIAFAISVFAQSQVKGKVTSFNKYALNHIEVIAKKSKQIAFTDSLGNFSISCKENEILRFNANGFYTSQKKSEKKIVLKINLIYMSTSLARDLAIHNNHISAEDLDYATEHLSDENNGYSNFQNIIELIQFVYPRASINKSGNPVKIFLNTRGPNSVYSDESALIVVDKIINDDISGISPSQVKKINVLLGSDASDYGVRGGNGVIEIELKH